MDEEDLADKDAVGKYKRSCLKANIPKEPYCTRLKKNCKINKNKSIPVCKLINKDDVKKYKRNCSAKGVAYDPNKKYCVNMRRKCGLKMFQNWAVCILIQQKWMWKKG